MRKALLSNAGEAWWLLVEHSYGWQHLKRAIIAAVVLLGVAVIATWIKWDDAPKVVAVLYGILAAVVVAAAIFIPAYVCTLLYVCLKKQVTAEKERNDAREKLSDLEKERDELKQKAESSPVASGKPEDSEELKDAKHRLRQEIAAALRVTKAGEMLEFTRGLQGYVRRRFIPEFAQQLSFAHGTQTGSVSLNLIDCMTRDKIVSTLEEMVRNVKEEHLTPSMSSLPPQTNHPSAANDRVQMTRDRLLEQAKYARGIETTDGMYSWMYQAHELCRQMFVPEFAKQFRMHLPPLGRNLTTEEDAILKEATSTLRGMATRVSIEHLRDQGG